MFRTYEPTRDRLVAVKVFRLDVTPEQAQALADELSRAAEAGLFHPSIVEPIAAGVEGTVAYRAEEYVAAESLDVAMRHYAPAPLDKVLPFMTQLAGAIDFARAAGVGHGALHPRDIFVTPDEARATGFGVVEALERVGLRAPVRRPYSAPERIAGNAWTTAADVFSLAAIAYELLTGKRPSGTGEQMGPVTGDNVGANGARIHAVLARGLNEDPAMRFKTALAFAAALEAAGTGETTTDVVRQVAAVPAPMSGGYGARRGREPRDLKEPKEPAERKEPESREPKEPREPPREPEIPPAWRTEPEPREPEELKTPREPQQEPDDVAIERAEDEAHEELTLFNAELAADRAETADQASRFADEFGAAERSERVSRRSLLGLTDLDDEVREKEPELAKAAAANDVRPLAPIEAEVREEQRGVESVYDEKAETSLAGEPAFYRGTMLRERSRPTMLERALILIVGLLLGFAGGYAVGGRDRQTSADSTQADRSDTTPPADATQPQSGRPYSEQEVTPQQRSAQPPGALPPTTAPPVPGEVPAPAAGVDSRTRPPAPRPAPPTARSTTAARRGRIVVQSTPSGAGVTVNGRWRGRTPLTLDDVAFGPYTVRIVQPGFTVAREEFSLSANEPSRTVNARLRASETAAAARGSQPGAGSVFVDSRPRGARVFIDGRAVGVTPLTIPDVKVGDHAVRLELEDHRTWETTARVEAGVEKKVTGSLERIR